MRWNKVLQVAGILLAMAPAMGHADAIFTGSGTLAGNSVSAWADFAISGNTLTITLQNTSMANTLEAPGNTLSGISFSLKGGAPSLTPVSAISPNAIFNPGACDVSCAGTNVNVGGEWGYQTLGSVELIGSAGYVTTGLASDLGNFNGSNLQNPASLDGIQFAIISADHGPLNGGGNGLANSALLDDKVVLTLTGVSSFQEGDLGGISFIYGTQENEGSIAGSCQSGCSTTTGQIPAPEPATLTLLGSALLGLGGSLRYRKRR